MEHVVFQKLTSRFNLPACEPDLNVIHFVTVHVYTRVFSRVFLKWGECGRVECCENGRL